MYFTNFFGCLGNTEAKQWLALD